MTRSAVLLALDALATYRLTRLVVEDSVTHKFRLWAGGAKGVTMAADPPRLVFSRPRLAEWVTCPWCASPYIAALVVVAQHFVPGVWLYVSAVLAFSAVAGLLSRGD